MGLETLENEMETLKAEYEKFKSGNNAAGTRARKSLQNIKKHAQDLRLEIQSEKNN